MLHEAEGHIVTVETTTGEVYRGKLIEAEDNMNSQMASVTVTYRDGRVAQLENIYIRGSKIRFMILPDMLKNAPMFKNMNTRGRGGAPRGKSGILRAQAGAGGRGRGRGDRGRDGCAECKADVTCDATCDADWDADAARFLDPRTKEGKQLQEIGRASCRERV